MIYRIKKKCQNRGKNRYPEIGQIGNPEHRAGIDNNVPQRTAAQSRGHAQHDNAQDVHIFFTGGNDAGDGKGCYADES